MTEMPDIEIGRYALRSFQLTSVNFTRSSGNSGWCRSDIEAAAEELGWWTDKTIKVWQAPSYPNPSDWRHGICRAKCRSFRSGAKDHAVPAEDCGCGIYGSLSYADLLSQFGEYTKHMVAVIAAEGKTIVGDRGLRTANAKVVAYWTDPDPIRRESAAAQFDQATVFDAVPEMVEAYRLAYLPPGKANTDGGSNYWTRRTLGGRS